MSEKKPRDDVWAYAHTYYDKAIAEDLGMLADSTPEAVERWLAFRQAVFAAGERSALSPRMKELIVTAIEVALCKTNPPPTFHAKKAVEAGATVQEVAQAIAAAIMLAGMVTYRESGRFALKAAIERATELESGKA